jgi:hypothetical protein
MFETASPGVPTRLIGHGPKATNAMLTGRQNSSSAAQVLARVHSNQKKPSCCASSQTSRKFRKLAHGGQLQEGHAKVHAP